jgi:hypothetical protein
VFAPQVPSKATEAILPNLRRLLVFENWEGTDISNVLHFNNVSVLWVLTFSEGYLWRMTGVANYYHHWAVRLHWSHFKTQKTVISALPKTLAPKRQ